MRLSVRFTISLFAVAALTLSVAAQAQSTASPTAGNGTYIAIDPLANVRYDNRYDLSLVAAYAHLKAGPNILHGASLGGLDLSGSYWLTKHWGIEGSGRGYAGTSDVAPNSPPNGQIIYGSYVGEYLFVAGPEWLGPHNKHIALIAHALVGGAYGDFERDLHGNSPSVVAFYNDQVAPAAVIGGHIDLNRSAHWVFRITPDALITRYGINYGPKTSQTDVNFGLSVGVQYKFSKKR